MKTTFTAINTTAFFKLKDLATTAFHYLEVEHHGVTIDDDFDKKEVTLSFSEFHYTNSQKLHALNSLLKDFKLTVTK